MYHLKERNLSQDFCKEEIAQIKNLIQNSTCFTILGMPGLGISIFLRFLVTQTFAYFIHVDIHELSDLTKEGLFKLLLKELGYGESLDNLDLIKTCASQLENLTQNHQRIVIVFNRFDQLKSEFSESFFGNLRTLRDVDKEKIVMVFAANKPLVEQSPESFMGGNLNMFSTNLYLKPFNKNDLLELIKLNASSVLSTPNLFKTIELSGGHYQLLMLLSKSEYQYDYLSDPMVSLQLKTLYENCNYKQKQQLQKIALTKQVPNVDPILSKLGYLNSNPEVFSPLFKDFIKSQINIKLSRQEEKLFKLLKQKKGKLVSKEEIFAKVWENGEATDWALDALIYKLRKNPVFSTRYIIENQKRLGYKLIKI